MDIAVETPQLSHSLTTSDVRGMWRMRWGIGRNDYRVEPGLYRLGSPESDSPIVVTGNYKFTVDVVRRDTEGLDAWLLVLDTRGINVWCAAGKGTFGTAELVRRVMASDLPLLAESQTLILPQLGAPGVAAHEVRSATGYRVVYGPVEAADLKAFIDAGNVATPEMREVRFGAKERLELAPVEVVGAMKDRRWLALVAVALFGALGYASAAWALIAVGFSDPASVSLQSAAAAGFYALVGVAWALIGLLLGGLVTPVLLPWVPGRMFAAKGALVGLLGLIGATVSFGIPGVGFGLFAMAISSFVAMNFTGTSPITSPTGVERELRRWIPIQLGLVALGVVWLLASPWVLALLLRSIFQSAA